MLEITVDDKLAQKNHSSAKGAGECNLQLENGYFTVPELPGLGNELLQSAIDNAVMFQRFE